MAHESARPNVGLKKRKRENGNVRFNLKWIIRRWLSLSSTGCIPAISSSRSLRVRGRLWRHFSGIRSNHTWSNVHRRVFLARQIAMKLICSISLFSDPLWLSSIKRIVFWSLSFGSFASSSLVLLDPSSPYASRNCRWPPVSDVSLGLQGVDS